MYSVLMSVYIREDSKNLSEAIDSMLCQSKPPSEIVIVKDGKLTQELEVVLNKYLNMYPSTFKIIGYEVNRGLGYALNYGLQNCTNELVARMDTDDIAESYRCEMQMKCFEQNSKLDIVGGGIEEFCGSVENVRGKRYVPTLHDDIVEYMKKRCPFNHMTVMFKKSAVINAGGYKDLFWNEDYFLWIRMHENGCTFLNINEILVKVRVNEDTYKRRGGIKYFRSEKFLQDYMLKKGFIGKRQYVINVFFRLILQVLLPNAIRGWIFRRFARTK